jgi:methylglutaconyl-CoA hydratase
VEFAHITSRRDGAIERLTLNRPAVRNAFNDAMIAELSAWAEAIAADHAVRAVVLTGAGPTFCAGADVSWMAKTIEYTEAENVDDARRASRMFDAINHLPVPVVGRVHGAAVGGGAGLVAVCDVVVAEPDATFGFTEVKLGIIPAVISPFVLGKIGQSAARELFLTGRRFSAQHALDIGLVHTIVPATDLDATVDAVLREVLAAGREAVAATKQLIADVARTATISDAEELTTRALAKRRVSAEGQEGLRAFLEKRRPHWSER